MQQALSARRSRPPSFVAHHAVCGQATGMVRNCTTHSASRPTSNKPTWCCVHHQPPGACMVGSRLEVGHTPFLGASNRSRFSGSAEAGPARKPAPSPARSPRWFQVDQVNSAHPTGCGCSMHNCCATRNPQLVALTGATRARRHRDVGSGASQRAAQRHGTAVTLCMLTAKGSAPPAAGVITVELVLVSKGAAVELASSRVNLHLATSTPRSESLSSTLP